MSEQLYEAFPTPAWLPFRRRRKARVVQEENARVIRRT